MTRPSAPDRADEDPVAKILDNAPVEDEPVSEEERAELEEARRQPTVDHETAKKRAGL